MEENEEIESVDDNYILRHSCAHVLGGALTKLYKKTNLAFGMSFIIN
jgi:threonyl-tRNA synthetase